MPLNSLTRCALALAIGFTAVTQLSCTSQEAEIPEGPRPRNVILFVTDTLRADRLGCYGYPRATSPNIDALAARGTLYKRNHSQGCWTVPSMISMMSGLYVTKEETVLPPYQSTLGETLVAGGMTTAAFVGNPVVSIDRGFSRGFESDFNFAPAAGTKPAGNTLDNGSALLLEKKFESWYKGNKADLEAGKGFVAWIHPMDPHFPYRPRKANPFPLGASRPDAAKVTPRWLKGQQEITALVPDTKHDSYTVSTRKMTYESTQYDGEVAVVDEAIGDLIAFLDAEGLTEDTLIIFAADHGEMLWEQRDYPFALDAEMRKEEPLSGGLSDYFGSGHRGWFFEELWNTPLIFAGPGFGQGVVSEELSANLDIYPTILEALDIPLKGALDGSSLLDNRPQERELIFAHGRHVTAVLRSNGEKLIEAYDPHPGKGNVVLPSLLLFDHKVDPNETENLAGARAKDVEALQAEMVEWRSKHERRVISTTSEESADVLGGLGYLD